jgi:hypothetical protein
MSRAIAIEAVYKSAREFVATGMRRTKGLKRGLSSGSLLLAISLAATPVALAPRRAGAAEVSASARANARRLVGEGDKFYAKQNYAQALERYAEAYRLMHVPTVGVEVVKAQEALGKILEAAQTAQEVSSLPRQANEPAVFGDARLQAAQDALRLNALTPTLLLDVAPRGVLFSVQIDGVAPRGSSPFPVNPGSHRVHVSADGYQGIEVDVLLQAAERQTLTVTLFPIAEATAAAAPPPMSAEARPAAERAPAQPAPAPAHKPSSTRTLGWVGMGVAGVGVAAGTFAGITALTTKPDCPHDICTPDQKQDIDSSKQMGHIADISFGVAIVAGALGIWALASSAGADDGEGAAASSNQLQAAGTDRIQLSSVDVTGDRAAGSLALRISGRF